MEKYINTNETNSMPIAFNITDKNSLNSQVLKKNQLKNKIPTDDFYRSSLKLSLKLIEIIK